MFLIVIRWVSTFYRYYSRYFHQSVWLSGYYCFLLGQYSSVRLKCILEVFSKAIISRRPYSVLLGFLEWTMWTLETFVSCSNSKTESPPKISRHFAVWQSRIAYSYVPTCYGALGLEHFSWFDISFLFFFFLLDNEEAHDHGHMTWCHRPRFWEKGLKGWCQGAC